MDRNLLAHILREDWPNRYKNISLFVDDIITYFAVQVRYSLAAPYYMAEEFDKRIPEIAEYIIINLMEEKERVRRWCHYIHSTIVESSPVDLGGKHLFNFLVRLCKNFIYEHNLPRQETFFGYMPMLMYLVFHLYNLNELQLMSHTVSAIDYIVFNVLRIQSDNDVQEMRQYAFRRLMSHGFFSAAFRSNNE